LLAERHFLARKPSYRRSDNAKSPANNEVDVMTAAGAVAAGAAISAPTARDPLSLLKCP
jgi:hypothetical protein